MAGDKYKVKITNVGVGDPRVYMSFYFEDGDGAVLPDTGSNMLENLTLAISMGPVDCPTGTANLVQVASMQVMKCTQGGSASSPLTLEVPFDFVGTYSDSEIIKFEIHATADENPQIMISDVNGNDTQSPNYYLRTLNSNITTENFSYDLKMGYPNGTALSCP